ncbi:MAG: hypothetical protein AAF353_20820 [Pseudomonadota bacterium]
MDDRQKREPPVLGVIRLDYDYPPALGDIDHPDTFNFDVVYRAVPGLTFEICQSGKISEAVLENCRKAVAFLNEKKVSGITGDCGFMLNIQDFVRNHTDKPVFMSCLGQLHSMIHSINSNAEIAVFTANSKSLEAVESELDRLSGLREHSHRLQIVGCESVPGFEAVAQGRKVDSGKVQPGVIRLAKEFLRNHPKVECILLECTELPPYADALRYETGLPVYDSVTNCNAFMSGYLDNQNFGMDDWQKSWAGPHKEYHLGENLSDTEKDSLINIDRE